MLQLCIWSNHDRKDTYGVYAEPVDPEEVCAILCVRFTFRAQGCSKIYYMTMVVRTFVFNFWFS